MIDWRDEPKPFSLSVRPQAFFSPAPLHFRLFTPLEPYDAAVHERAFRTGDYAPLVRERELWGRPERGRFDASIDMEGETPLSAVIRHQGFPNPALRVCRGYGQRGA